MPRTIIRAAIIAATALATMGLGGPATAQEYETEPYDENFPSTIGASVVTSECSEQGPRTIIAAAVNPEVVPDTYRIEAGVVPTAYAPPFLVEVDKPSGDSQVKITVAHELAGVTAAVSLQVFEDRNGNDAFDRTDEVRSHAEVVPIRFNLCNEVELGEPETTCIGAYLVRMSGTGRIARKHVDGEPVAVPSTYRLAYNLAPGLGTTLDQKTRFDLAKGTFEYQLTANQALAGKRVRLTAKGYDDANRNGRIDDGELPTVGELSKSQSLTLPTCNATSPVKPASAAGPGDPSEPAPDVRSPLGGAVPLLLAGVLVLGAVGGTALVIRRRRQPERP